jgi:hypothetical protein
MPPLPLRAMGLFALRFGLVYTLAVLAWPLVRPVYQPVYCFLGNILFEGGTGSVRFEAARTGDDFEDDFDVQLVMTNTEAAVTGRAGNSSRVTGYLPTVSLVALVLATPIAWRRRRRALWMGLLAVHVFVALRMALPIWRDFALPGPLQVYEPGGFVRWARGVAERAFLAAPASFFVVPVLIWVLVAFTGRDRELLAAPDGEPR